METLQLDILKVGVAIVIGGLIGAEREFRDKSAGFRTIIFICLGATLFTIFSERFAGDNDPTRISANVVTGIGFLGAGAILREGNRVIGLTTAATIWLAAAIGVGIGGGEIRFVCIAAAAAIIVLGLFPRFEHWIDNLNETRQYEIVAKYDDQAVERLRRMFADCGLHVRSHKEAKRDQELVLEWNVAGSPDAHERLKRRLFEDAAVREFKA